MQIGMNILKMSNGETRKVVEKQPLFLLLFEGIIYGVEEMRRFMHLWCILLYPFTP